MRLKYVKGSEVTVKFGDEKARTVELSVSFSPEGEVPEQFAERLLKKHPNLFVKVEAEVEKPTTKAVCDVCKREFKNAQGVIIHKKRTHKDKQ